MDQEKYINLFEQLDDKQKSFAKYHGIQLMASNFPASAELLKQLIHKIENQIYDAGSYFQIIDNADEERFEVKCIKPVTAKSNVFLIDHAVTWKFRDIGKIVSENDNARARIMNMLQYSDGKKKISTSLGKAQISKYPEEEYDEQNLEDPTQLNIQDNCVVLSFYDNNIMDLQLVDSVLNKLLHLKVLYLNKNPVSEGKELIQLVESNFKQIEILNSKFTSNVTDWGVKLVTFDFDKSKCETRNSNKMRYLNLSGRNVLALKNLDFLDNFPNVRELNLKDHELLELEQSNIFFQLLHKMKKLDNIYVDTQIEDILFELYESGKLQLLAPTLSKVNGYEFKQGRIDQKEIEIAYIKKNIWKLANSYRLANSEQLDDQSIWYLMDEFGSAIQHSDNFNVKMTPFLHMPNNKMDDQVQAYSILWPTKNIEHKDLISRDYLSEINEDNMRSARLSCWYDVPQEFFLNKYKEFKQNLKSKNAQQICQDYMQNHQQLVLTPETRKFKVLTDSNLILNSLTHPQFEFTDDPLEADIYWLNQSIDTFDEITDKLISQFPYESCIVNKEDLAQTIQNGIGYVSWQPMTHTNFHTFLGDFFNREQKNKSNLWIIKNPNMSRSLDMIVSDNLSAISRLLETGPRLFQKYVDRPLTLRNKKIDIRIHTYVRSMEPLSVYCDKIFWSRISNNDYSLDPRTFQEYETHFTVMNYGPTKLNHVHYDIFINEFNQENAYRNVTWQMVYDKIMDILKQIFISIKRACPKMVKENSRAFYGWDFMFDNETLEPVLLECSFTPDGTRAVKYHPEVYNEIFACLFLNQISDHFDKLF